MARGPRLNIPDGIYHVMTRGHRKAVIFEDDGDRRRFIEIAVTAAAEHEVRMFAECRLGNHYHLVVQTPRANLPDYMHDLNGSFAQFSNRRHQRIGHVYNERYQPILVDNDFHLRIATAYVLTNAVKHRFVDQPGDWKWSSYRATAGLEAAPEYLCLDWLGTAFPSRTLAESQSSFCRYLRVPIPSESEEWIGEPLVGSSAFEHEVREHIGATLYLAQLPRSYRALDRPPLAELLRGPMTKADRNKQMLRAHVVHAYRVSEIARALYMHPTTVSRILAALRRTAGGS